MTPGSNFTLTQNSVNPFTSISSGAVANTLYLANGRMGIGTSSPASALHVLGAQYNTATIDAAGGYSILLFLTLLIAELITVLSVRARVPEEGLRI